MVLPPVECCLSRILLFMRARGTIVTATPVKSGPRLILLLLFALTAPLMHSEMELTSAQRAGGGGRG